MSIEQRTRTEVINALIAVSDALRLLLTERAVAERQDLGPPLTSVHEMNETPAQTELAVQKAKRVNKAAAKNPQEPKPELPVLMADIKPTKTGKTLADLRVALQACITVHGMAVAKDRLVPYAKVSDVPDEAIGDVIKALSA